MLEDVRPRIEEALALRPDILQALRRYRELLTTRFGSRLESVSLFGSQARNEAREDSDIDVLVLIRGADWREEREAAMFGGDVAVDTGVWLSPSIHASEAFARMPEIEQPFARAVAREALPV